MSIKEKIGEISDASGKMLVPEHENHLAKRLLLDLIAKTETELELDELLVKYSDHFPEEEFTKLIYEAKKEKGLIRG